MQMRKSKWLSLFLVFAMVLGFMAPLNVQTAYADDSVSVELKATKVLEGGTLEADQFTFKIEAKTEGAPMPEKAEAKNDAEGNISFGNATYTAAGTYEYTVTEVEGEDKTVKYDTEVKTLTVTVTAASSADGEQATPNNGDKYLPQKHDTGQTTAPINVTYNHGGDDEAGWYSAKSVSFEGGPTENVFCGVNYKSGSGRDFGTRSIWNADANAWQAPTGILWGVETPSGVIDLIPAGCGKDRNRWLDYVAYLYTFDYRNRDSAGSSGAWPSSDDPDVMSGWELRDAVQKVLWNGYPYNAAGFTNVSALRKTTQEALFFVLKCGQGYKDGALDNTAGGFRDFADGDMFDKLINYALKGQGGLKNYPEGTETYVYWPTEFADGATGCKTLVPQPLIGIYAPWEAPALTAECSEVEFKNEVKTDEPTKPTVKTKVSPNEVEAAPDQTFVDTVTLTNLVEGVEYTITGALMDKEAQEKVEATCEPVVFTASAEDAAAESVEKKMEFTFDGTNFEGKELVVFETLSWKEGDETKEVPHTDYDDADQTITVKPKEEKPTVKTKANPSEIEAAADQTITDTITLENLTVGTEYTVTGKLMDADGNEVEATCEPITFTAENAKEEHEMVFTLDATEYAGKKLVVFETLTWADGEVKHEDLKDEDQTVSVKKPEEPEKPKEYTVKISKNALGGAEVPGAKMVLTDSEGTEVANWESTDKAHEVQLKAGKYVLEEKVAPDGYKQVTTKIEFEVTEDGTVNLITTTVDAGGKISVKEGDHIVLEDALKDDKEPTDEDGSTTPGGDDKEGEQEPGGEAPDPNKDNKDTTPNKDDSSKPSNDTPSKKPNNTPKTGDESNAAMWFAILGLAGAALAGTKLVSKKK